MVIVQARLVESLKEGKISKILSVAELGIGFDELVEVEEW